MVKYSLPKEYPCWKCQNCHTPTASLNKNTVTWQCNTCGEPNFVLVDTIQFRIGQRLLLSAERLLHNDEPDLASVLLYSAVDASLSQGIIELENWRNIENNQPPRLREKIEEELRRMNMVGKVDKYQSLAGATIDEEITRLSDNDAYYKEVFGGISCNTLREKFEILAKERHKLIHYGEEVDSSVIQSSIIWVNHVIIILNSLWHAAFSERKQT